jgi:hypothetical protein
MIYDFCAAMADWTGPAGVQPRGGLPGRGRPPGPRSPDINGQTAPARGRSWPGADQRGSKGAENSPFRSALTAQRRQAARYVPGCAGLCRAADRGQGAAVSPSAPELLFPGVNLAAFAVRSAAPVLSHRPLPLALPRSGCFGGRYVPLCGCESWAKVNG